MNRLSVKCTTIVLFFLLIGFAGRSESSTVFNMKGHGENEGPLPMELPISIMEGTPFRPVRVTPYEWVKENKIIAHGMGGVEGKRVTNSLKAFQYNYTKGIRVFEVDLVFTTDGHLVARHDWHTYMYPFLGQEKKADQLSLQEFKGLKIHKGWEPLSVYDLIILMEKYPDVYFVTDTKLDNARVIAEVAAQFSKVDRSLLQRVIPQVYSPEDYRKIKEIYPFENLILTLYRSSMSQENVLAFTRKSDLKVVTLSQRQAQESFIERLKRQGISVYVHTINNKVEAKTLLNQGVSGIYTDYLSLNDLK
ncbi:phosphatidylinositol-specific phospholipase C/glycerophosphodiester phosphodiesterase family protein [Neobacillus niacini]|uniref:phosphatidylinositol-specific phospholipase C/glycerophosphodiester phosphodiesterase family protein n=1 Tax=Neobacillus niacini TaxID=86668 RepID=UPI0028627DEC|nr:phosphatidylinositol-specific phospholipase C/glycerophosphodiester phosphodiesterase family protein [Neobacillus niacini]MDR6998922.1 glycerophosphoryl diester phosphodiesterase [Neobacillus niacini]